MKRAKLLCALVFSITAAAGVYSQTPKSNWANYEGAKIRYYDIGDRHSKKALVLVHCWTCNAEFWSDSYNAFPQYRVIALDLPGHGESDKPKTTYSMEYLARALDAVLKTAKVDQAVLVGHSMGTPVARQYYRLFPKKVAGIVIVDSSLMPFFTKEQGEQMMAAFHKDFRGTAAPFINGMVKPIQSDTLKKKITDTMLAAPEYVAVSAMQGMMEPKIWTNDQVNVPVLAVMAPSPAETEKKFRAIAPDLQYEQWSGVTHFLMMERPRQFNELVAAFITRKKLL
jgi:pimeloyl-ACP methyl ester carboxylesterase